MLENGIWKFHRVIEEIADLNWSGLTSENLVEAAWAYHAFSVQFRENLKIARSVYPSDPLLAHLEREECDTDNLSPWPGIAAPGERMNHDEFMRRIIIAAPLPEASRKRLETETTAYRQAVEHVDATARAMSIASYEDGGLECVFRAILRAPDWDGPAQRAFHHFLSEHIRFDSDADHGHGALSRHLPLDDRVLPLWTAFLQLLVGAVPALRQPTAAPRERAAEVTPVLAAG
jgi:hypothetical protein